MIYVMDLDGTILASSVSNINQGENRASEITLLAPFPSYYSVRVKVKLPNGIILPASFAEPDEAFIMTPIDNLQNFAYRTAPDGSQVGYNAWKLTVLYPITQNFGNAKISFVLTGTNGVTKTSTEVDLTINKSTPLIEGEMPTPEDIEEILNYVSLAGMYAADADGYAQGAETSQENALRYATQAESAKNDAQASAVQAAESANAAVEALTNKLDKVTTNPTGDILLYGVANGGAQEMVRASDDSAGGRVKISTNDGQLNAPNQVNFVPKPDQFVSRRWVENGYGDLPGRVSTLESALISFDEDDSTAYKKTAPLTSSNIAILTSIKGKSIGGVGTNKFDPYLFKNVFQNFEVSDDGTIHGDAYWTADDQQPLADIYLPAGTWTIKSSGGATALPVFFSPYNDYNLSNGRQTITLSEPTNVSVYYMQYWSEDFVRYSFKVMLNEGSTALPYEPYQYAPTAVTAVKSYSANLIVYPYANGGAGTVREFRGVTYTVREDRSIYAKGTAVGDLSYFLIANNIYLGNYEMGGGAGQGATNQAYSISSRLYYNGSGKISFGIDNGTSVDDVLYPMANKGSRLLPYVPYFDPITLTIPTEITSLPGYGLSMPDGSLPNELVFDSTTKTYKYIQRCELNSNGIPRSLSTPVTTDVTSYLSGILSPAGYINIHVQGGGEIEFVNTNEEPVPTSITFLLTP